MLLNVPSWAFEADPKAREFILHRYARISAYKTDEIREGISWFLNNITGMSLRVQAEQRAKVVLLNRVLFSVPKIVSEQNARSGVYCWLGIKTDDGYNVQIPLVEDASGILTIGGNELAFPDRPDFSEVLAEYDFFSAKFKRTHVTENSRGEVRRQ